jgi:hypothetical protein
MKTFTPLTLLIMIPLFSIQTTASAKEICCDGSGGWHHHGTYGRMYDTSKTTSLSGEIISVNRTAPMHGMSIGIQISVKSEKEALDVHLGPSWYLDKQDFKLSIKDKVSIKGALVTMPTGKTLIASEITKGKATLKLRESDGTPLWSGWRGM